jgi:hypothetical protein
VIVFFGCHNYGKVHHVPGLFYVVTRFAHLNGVPLLPLKSYLVVERFGPNVVQPIPLNLHSALIGWLRALLWVFAAGAVLGALFAAPAALERPRQWPALATLAAIAFGTLGLLWVSHRLTRAGPGKAIHLAGRFGVPIELVAEHFASYPDIDCICEGLRQEQGYVRDREAASAESVLPA